MAFRSSSFSSFQGGDWLQNCEGQVSAQHGDNFHFLCTHRLEVLPWPSSLSYVESEMMHSTESSKIVRRDMPPATEEEWSRRIVHRKEAVTAVKRTA